MQSSPWTARAVILAAGALVAGFADCEAKAPSAHTPLVQPSSSDIVAVGSGECLNVSGAGSAPGTPIIQTVCDGQPDNTWQLVPVGSHYHLVAGNSGQCLNVPGASQAAGTQLITWPCQSAAALNDQWRLVPVGTSFHIVSASSGQCVNVYGGSVSPGAAIVQWPCQGATTLNDQFDLYAPTTGASTLVSQWSPVITLPVTPIGLANLPGGNLLMWSADAPYSFEGDIGAGAGQTYTGIFNPATQTSTEVLETSAGSDLFCPGTAVLPNGQILINGGSSSAKTTIYDPASNAWSAAAQMNIWRGYEADAPLSNGSVLTIGGSWSGGQGGKTAEVWNAASGWKVLSGVPENNIVGPDPQGIYRGDNHVWLFSWSNGTVFQPGPSAQMNWITTQGAGTITSAGNRGSDPFSINGNAVMYDVGKILKVGGAAAYQQNGSTTTYATNSAYVIDMSGGASRPVKLQQVTSMTYPRSFANAVVLPNGSVVVVGGQSIPQPFTDTAAVMVPELWNPATQTFNLLAPMQIPRTYHSTALLMADGRVFVGGGGQCGVGCPQNHLDAEILTPPYLLTASGAPAARPVIQSAPASATLGTSIKVTASGGVTSFVAMRLSATTHTVNNDQRRVPLQTIATGPNAFQVLLPADPGIALPGNYMLFGLTAAGVPSVSVPLSLQAGAGSPPANAVACGGEGATCALPAGTTATVWFGATGHWALQGAVTGSIGCNTAVFGDPDVGVVKSCSYVLSPPAAVVQCAVENQTCTLPAGKTATVWYGADTHWTAHASVSGSVACSNAVFGDPDYGVGKACAYQAN